VKNVFAKIALTIVGVVTVAGCTAPMDTSSNAATPMGGNFSASAAQRPPYAVPAAPPSGIAPATINGTPVPSYGGTYNPVSGESAGGRTGNLTTNP
jgi:hypothetical protein